jgi:hypothetical protein
VTWRLGAEHDSSSSAEGAQRCALAVPRDLGEPDPAEDGFRRLLCRSASGLWVRGRSRASGSYRARHGSVESASRRASCGSWGCRGSRARLASHMPRCMLSMASWPRTGVRLSRRSNHLPEECVLPERRAQSRAASQRLAAQCPETFLLFLLLARHVLTRVLLPVNQLHPAAPLLILLFSCTVLSHLCPAGQGSGHTQHGPSADHCPRLLDRGCEHKDAGTGSGCRYPRRSAFRRRFGRRSASIHRGICGKPHMSTLIRSAGNVFHPPPATSQAVPAQRGVSARVHGCGKRQAHYDAAARSAARPPSEVVAGRVVRWTGRQPRSTAGTFDVAGCAAHSLPLRRHLGSTTPLLSKLIRRTWVGMLAIKWGRVGSGEPSTADDAVHRGFGWALCAGEQRWRACWSGLDESGLPSSGRPGLYGAHGACMQKCTLAIRESRSGGTPLPQLWGPLNGGN